MRPLHTITVVPRLPAPLEPLRRVAGDLRWAWRHDALELFRRLDSELWERSGHNPVLMLGTIDQARLDEAAEDPAFLGHLQRVVEFYDEYDAAASTWFARTHGEAGRVLIAYFSAEFGITECLSIFAGGLGILAGDHLKSASDLGVPLVGVGLLYQKGYFRQHLNEAGWQQEFYEENDFFTLPVEQVATADGPLMVEIPFPGRTVRAAVWRAKVGRVDLYLLDTNHAGNDPADRDITDQLYGGDGETRMKQEMVLGIGGYRALEALGLRPSVYHMNEGHSAFLVLERIRRLMESDGLTFAEAREAAAGLVFTTHTPVPAGHDKFPPDLVDRYLGWYAGAFGIGRQQFLDLGRERPGDERDLFNNTVLALRTASFSNGVSRLHGSVSRAMFTDLWPGVPRDEIPITSITNGVHLGSWLSLEMKQLFDRYLGPAWREEPADDSTWAKAARIPPEELWRTHQRRRERLVSFARRRLRSQLARRGAPEGEVSIADVVLDPGALTIGFARRFATYKRATLLLRDPERLAAILDDEERPVQIVYAGKAHPRDDAGKALIQEIIRLTRRPEIRRHLVFIDDYDMAAARYLLQGCDVWLNNPIRPLEASGTSGMKAAANGVLNLSTLDGWWDEAYDSEVGWAIGRGESYDDPERRDQVESDALYDLLERDVVPAFYDRGVDRLPRRWIERMQASIARLNYSFNTHRMVREYTEACYLPAAGRTRALQADGSEAARRLAAWKERVRAAWPGVRVLAVEGGAADGIEVGEPFEVRARIDLNGLAPDDVAVEVYLGRIDGAGDLVEAGAVSMEPVGPVDGAHGFRLADVRYRRSGRHGFTVRVLPRHEDLDGRLLPGLITWA
jgi:starch phosphorylase